MRLLAPLIYVEVADLFGGEKICFAVKDMFGGDRICLVMPHNMFGGG